MKPPLCGACSPANSGCEHAPTGPLPKAPAARIQVVSQAANTAAMMEQGRGQFTRAGSRRRNRRDKKSQFAESAFLPR